MADVVVILEVVCAFGKFTSHLHTVSTDLTAAHEDLGMTTAWYKFNIGNIELTRLRINDGIPVEVAHIGHLTAAIHTTVDDRSRHEGGTVDGVLDDHLGVSGQGKEQSRGCWMSGEAFHGALATAINVTHGVLGKGLHEFLITNLTTFHDDLGVTVTVARSLFTRFVDTGQG